MEPLRRFLFFAHQLDNVLIGSLGARLGGLTFFDT